MQPILAIATLTWKSAFRYRLFWVLLVALMSSVVLLPLILKDDGTARGFVQILLTYTLGLILALLGVSTLWLSCGAMARDVEECQIQMVVVKPVGRWKVWIGKWLGILMLNTCLLSLSGASVYTLLQWRASHLTPFQQRILREEILVSRASFKPLPAGLDEEIERRFKATRGLENLTPQQRLEVRYDIAKRVYVAAQIVPPRQVRTWAFDLGYASRLLSTNQYLSIRVKFYPNSTNETGLYKGMWFFSRPGIPERTDYEPFPLASAAPQEFRVRADLPDAQGRLLVHYQSLEDITLIFPLDEGIEILYRDSGFGLNFARGLGILLAWLALLSAIGLSAASVSSFPVATFFSLSLLIVVFSSGTLSESVQDQNVLSGRPDEFQTLRPVANAILLPVFRGVLALVKAVDVASPVESLSNGQSITWSILGTAWLQVVGGFGGVVAGIGIWLFSRRELAAAQGTS
ncbi:MAG: ABC transporter permease [Verrucomicrobia bacterium]|nr:ABC transporter permease [Verrucomicrobiota bacterium]MBI3869011.1 ABC transporter permease [Verrucomicrobiota bacterium]